LTQFPQVKYARFPPIPIGMMGLEGTLVPRQYHAMPMG